MSELLAIQLAATWALVGLIWTIQLIHYPLFAQVGGESFPAYHKRHGRLITYLVAPLMATELLSAVALVLLGFWEPWFLLSLIPLGFNWFSTWAIQIPLHTRLAAGFDASTHQSLVRSNWWRTAAWTLRGLLLLSASPGFVI